MRAKLFSSRHFQRPTDSQLVFHWLSNTKIFLPGSFSVPARQADFCCWKSSPPQWNFNLIWRQTMGGRSEKNPKLMAKSHIQKKKEKPKSRQRSSRCQHRRDLKSHRCRIHTIVDQQRAPEALGNTPRDYPAIEMPTARTPEERTPRPPPCFLPALVRPPVGDPDLPVPFTNKSLKRRIP